MSFNQFSGIGNLAAQPESRTTQSGSNVTTFTVCCDGGWGDNKRTEFVRCVCFGKLADIVAQYGEKGKKVFVQGEMKTDKYQDQNGVDKYSTNIIVNTYKMLSGKSDTGGVGNYGGGGYEQPQHSTGDDVSVPF